MATIKFSEFDAGNINAGGAQIVGLEGGTNKRFTAADLVNGLATVTYVDAQDTNLQNQITQNANDIANIDLDTGNVEANIVILQGQVTVIEGNIVVLESAVAALQNNVTINQDDITVIRGNITVIEQQIADLEANGNIQTLSLDNSSNVLSISGGNTVDFTTVLGNVVGADAQTLSWDTANANLSISGGNTVTLDGLGGDSNIAVATASDGQQYLTTFDQNFFITNDPTVTDTAYIAMGESASTNWNSGAYELHGTGSGKGMFNSKTLTNKIAHNGPHIGIAAFNDFYLGSRYAALYSDNSYDVTLSSDPLGSVNLAIDNTDKLVVDGPTDSIQVSANVIPSANITYDLGSATNRFKDLYLSNSTIYLGDSTISSANGSLSVDGQVLENTFSTSTPVLNTNTDVYANNGVGNPTGAPLPSPDKKNGWYWVSPGGSGTDRSIQWRLYNNAGPQDFAVEDVEYMYMVVDLKALGDVYFNIYTMDAFPNVPSSFNKRFSFALNGSHSSTGTYLLWAKPPGSSTTVEQVAVYQQFPRIELPFQSAFSTGTIADVGETIKNIAITTSTSAGAGDVEFTLKTTGYKVRQGLIQDFNPVVGNPFDQDLNTTDNVEFAQISVANTTVTSNATTSSMDVQFDSKPVAKITSGVMVQVHGSWDASAGAAFNWATDEIASHGISNVTRDSTGIYTVTFETPFASNAYTATFGVGSTDYSGTGASPREVSLYSRNAGNCTVICERSDDAVNEDNFYMSLMICGII